MEQNIFTSFRFLKTRQVYTLQKLQYQQQKQQQQQQQQHDVTGKDVTI